MRSVFRTVHCCLHLPLRSHSLLEIASVGSPPRMLYYALIRTGLSLQHYVKSWLRTGLFLQHYVTSWPRTGHSLQRYVTSWPKTGHSLQHYVTSWTRTGLSLSLDRPCVRWKYMDAHLLFHKSRKPLQEVEDHCNNFPGMTFVSLTSFLPILSK